MLHRIIVYWRWITIIKIVIRVVALIVTDTLVTIITGIGCCEIVRWRDERRIKIRLRGIKIIGLKRAISSIKERLRIN